MGGGLSTSRRPVCCWCRLEPQTGTSVQKEENCMTKSRRYNWKLLKINILYSYFLSRGCGAGASFLCGACEENGGAERTEGPFTFFLFLKARMERWAISQRPRVIQAARADMLSVISHKNRMASSAASKKIPRKRQYSDSPLCLARGEKSARRHGISRRRTRKSSMVFVMINRNRWFFFVYPICSVFGSPGRCLKIAAVSGSVHGWRPCR